MITERAIERNRKLLVTPELLTEIGASGDTLKEAARKRGVSTTVLSRAINQSLTNKQAYERGKAKLKTL